MSSPSPTSDSPSPGSSAVNLPASVPPTSHPAQIQSADGSENAHGHTRLFRPRLSFAGAAGQDGRRPSVQFATVKTGDGGRASSPKPRGSPKAIPLAVQRRLSSPPPPSKYERRVSFNTFDNRDATDYSFTIATKHKDYHYTQRSRTFLCGTDDNDYSYDAIEWLIEELVEDGDEIICLRVVDKDSRFASDASLRNGSYKREAEHLLEKIKNKNKHKGDEKEKAIGLAIEFAVGKVPEVFQRMITVYAPACLIVGTKGKSPSGMQSFVTGSVSRYCLQNSPVPCIVVRPTRKRLAKKHKRLADEKRRDYQNVMELSGARGSQQALASNDGKGMERLVDGMAAATTVSGTPGVASEKEAQAVAKAIGLPRSLSRRAGSARRSTTPTPDDEGAPLARRHKSNEYAASSLGGDSPSPTGAFVVSGENSPEFEPLDSPAMSEDEDEEEEREDANTEARATQGKAEEEEVRGRTRTQSSDEQGEKKTTGAKTFVFPSSRRKSDG
ncbi:MAG: hypothetical protein Q9220_001023 [cf. Caloplaca sp. 1 TL-2023]